MKAATKTHGKLKVSAQGDKEIVMSRVFSAPRNLVFEAYTSPELLKRWLGVRNGWSLAVCEIDLKVGGSYRYLWRNECRKIDMGAGGVYREVEAPERFVCTEKFDDPWYPGESLLTTVLSEQGNDTTLTVTIQYESAAARDGVLNSPMESGVAESYDTLDDLLTVLASRAS